MTGTARVVRAGGACEYCRLLQAATGVLFHIEHVLPQSRGGQTVMSNLALSCPGCNLAKAERTTGEDRTGKTHEGEQADLFQGRSEQMRPGEAGQ